MTGELAAVAPADDTDTRADRLAALFDAHHRRLYVLARRLSSNAEDARDLVQETFLRAARAPASVPAGTRAEEAWLVRVLVNLCRDAWRQRATRQRLDAERGEPASTRTSGDAEGACVARATIWGALTALPPRRRAVVVLHELEGRSVEEISRLLRITRVTVRWHLSRGRRELARLIAGEKRTP